MRLTSRASIPSSAMGILVGVFGAALVALVYTILAGVVPL